MRIICFLAVASNLLLPKAHAIMFQCPNGMGGFGPLYTPEVCEERARAQTSNGQIGQTYESCVAGHVGPNPEWGCFNLPHAITGTTAQGGGSGGGGGQGTTGNTSQGPKYVSAAVDFHFESEESCKADLSSRAAAMRANPQMPDQFQGNDGLSRLCHSLGNGGSITMNVLFYFPRESDCVNVLRNEVKEMHGEAKVDSGDEQSFCHSAFTGSKSGNSSGTTTGTAGTSSSSLGDGEGRQDVKFDFKN